MQAIETNQQLYHRHHHRPSPVRASTMTVNVVRHGDGMTTSSFDTAAKCRQREQQHALESSARKNDDHNRSTSNSSPSSSMHVAHEASSRCTPSQTKTDEQASPTTAAAEVSNPTADAQATDTSQASLLQALGVVSQLAAMDSDEYQTTVLRQRSPRNSVDSNSSSFSGENNNMETAPHQHHDESLEEQHQEATTATASSSSTTPLLLLDSLTRHIHRFQSNVLLLQNESDSQATEILALQKLLLQVQEENRHLSAKCHQLQGQNSALTQKLQTAKQERKVLVSHCKSLQDRIVSADQQHEQFQTLKQAYLLQSHEKQCLLNSYNQNSTANRSRTTSVESVKSTCTTPNLSVVLGDGVGGSGGGLDGFLLQHPSSSHREPPPALPMMLLDNNNNGEQHQHQHAEEASDSSISTLVTDEGVATLKLSLRSHDDDEHEACDSPLATAAGMTSIHSTGAAAATTDDSTTASAASAGTAPSGYTLTFRRGTKVGILIRDLALPAEDDHHEFHSTASQKKKKKHKKKIKQQPPNLELTKALLQDQQNKKQPVTTPAAGQQEDRNNNNKLTPFSLKFNMNPFHSSSKSDAEEKKDDTTSTDSQQQQQNQQRREPEPQRYAHIVSGYNAFDEKQNATKPALGARIVAINQIAVPETFTLAELLDSLKANSDNAMLDDDSYSAEDHEYETYTVTFRNDPLTAAQRQALHLPLLQDDDDSSSGNDDGPTTPAITPCGSSDREDAAAMTTTTTTTSKKTGGGGGGFHFGFIRLGAAGENSNHNSLANRARTWSSSSQKSVPKEPVSLPEETACSTTSTAKSGGNTVGGGDTTETTTKKNDDVTTATMPAAATTASTKETTANAAAAATDAVAAEEEQQQSSSSSSLRPGDITRTAKDVLQFWKPSAAARQQQQDESASQ